MAVASMKCTVEVCENGVDLTPSRKHLLSDCCGLELPVDLSHCVDSVQVTLKAAERIQSGPLKQVGGEPLKWIMPHFSDEMVLQWRQVEVVKFSFRLHPEVQLCQLSLLATHIRSMCHREGREAWVRSKERETSSVALLRSLFVHPVHIAALMATTAPASSIIGVLGTIDLPHAPATGKQATLHLHLPPPKANCILVEAWIHVDSLTNAYIKMKEGLGLQDSVHPMTKLMKKDVALIQSLPPIFRTQWWFCAQHAAVPTARLNMTISPLEEDKPFQLETVHDVNVVAFFLEVPKPLTKMDSPLNGRFPSVMCGVSLSQRMQRERGFNITRWQFSQPDTMTASWLAPPTDVVAGANVVTMK